MPAQELSDPRTPLQRLTSIRDTSRDTFRRSLPPSYRAGTCLLDRAAWTAADYLVCLARYGVSCGMSPADFPYWLDSSANGWQTTTASANDISTRGLALHDDLWSGGVGPGVLRTSLTPGGDALAVWLADSEAHVLEYLNRPYVEGGYCPSGMHFETCDNSLWLLDDADSADTFTPTHPVPAL